MKPQVESAEVLYAPKGIVVVDDAIIADLVTDAAKNPRRRIRLCAHSGVTDPLHEMFIVHERGCYVRPHKHFGKSESFHVVSGDVDVVVFDDSGNILNVIAMGPYGSQRPFFYRIAEPLFHTLLIRSDVLVFHETTSGPFKREQTLFAPWSPTGDDPHEVKTFLQLLNKNIVSWSSSEE